MSLRLASSGHQNSCSIKTLFSRQGLNLHQQICARSWRSRHHPQASHPNFISWQFKLGAWTGYVKCRTQTTAAPTLRISQQIASRTTMKTCRARIHRMQTMYHLLRHLSLTFKVIKDSSKSYWKICKSSKITVAAKRPSRWVQPKWLRRNFRKINSNKGKHWIAFRTCCH
jgi:hypothetical protein